MKDKNASFFLRAFAISSVLSIIVTFIILMDYNFPEDPEKQGYIVGYVFASLLFGPFGIAALITGYLMKKGSSIWSTTKVSIVCLLIGCAFFALMNQYYEKMLKEHGINLQQNSSKNSQNSPENQQENSKESKPQFTTSPIPFSEEVYEKEKPSENLDWVKIVYKEKDFSKLENHIKTILNQPQDEDTSRYLNNLYNTLTNLNKDDDGKILENIYLSWCQENQESHIAFMLLGNFYIEYAWQIRGSGFASTVKKEAWTIFYQRLESAKLCLEKSYELNSNDPNSSAALITAAKGLDLSNEEINTYFNNAISAYPGHSGAHWAKIDALQPKWGGSQREVDEFLIECDHKAKEYPYIGLIRMRYLHKSQKRDASYWQKQEVWDDVEKIYSSILRKNSNSLITLLDYSYYAYEAKKYEIAAELFDKIGNRWLTYSSWSQQYFNNARVYVYGTRSYANLMRRNVEAAEIDLLKMIAISPKDPGTYQNLAILEVKFRRNYKKAIEYTEKFLECDLTENQRKVGESCLKQYNAYLKK